MRSRSQTQRFLMVFRVDFFVFGVLALEKLIDIWAD